MARKKKEKSFVDSLEKPDDFVEETNPDVLFAESSPSVGEEAYIGSCPKCGATVTRSDYKCPKCGNLLI
ncbi:MAG: zinc ribbon domain-containing protein [Promethearchaeota archaeon]